MRNTKYGIEQPQILSFLITEGSQLLAQDPAVALPIRNMLVALFFPPIAPGGWRLLTAEVWVRFHMQVAVSFIHYN